MTGPDTIASIVVAGLAWVLYWADRVDRRKKWESIKTEVFNDDEFR